MNKPYAVFWKEDDHEKLLSWWTSLKRKPGWRAELRRADTPADVLLCQGFRYLCYDLAGYWTTEKNILGLAAVAGIVSHIDTDKTGTFAENCAKAMDGRSKPAVSELRFSQLQKSRTLDELYTRMIRTIHLLKKSASPLSVADAILHWVKEMVNDNVDSDPRNRIRVRWGLDYFQNVPKNNI